MIGPQYKNIIQWTLKYELSETQSDDVSVIRKIFSNLGVAFPLGNLSEIISILKSKTYMGWRQCSINEVQRYADAGVASIGISNSRVIIIMPDDKITNFSSDREIVTVRADFIKHTSELSEQEQKMCFFVYSYGYVFEEK